jgi:diguanylate cyclase (GGDEF)-like protein
VVTAGAADPIGSLVATVAVEDAIESWNRHCSGDGVLSGGAPIDVFPSAYEAFVEALGEPYGADEEIQPVANVASDLLNHAGTGGLASRLLLALGNSMATTGESATGSLRAEFDRRLRVVLGRFLLYVNLIALRQADNAARRDALTGLRNRHAFDGDLERYTLSGQQYTIAFIDVDGLKKINDGQGHEAGDALLKRVAVVLQEACGGGDYAYRFGGDEYAFVSTVRTVDELEELLAERSSESTPFSWGVASCPADGQSAKAVVDLADARMYQRKKKRKSRRSKWSRRLNILKQRVSG